MRLPTWWEDELRRAGEVRPSLCARRAWLAIQGLLEADVDERGCVATVTPDGRALLATADLARRRAASRPSGGSL